jgi:uncharacterized protein (TIGR03086 family)
MEPDEQLALMLPILTNIVGRIEPSQLDLPTPCAAFNVRGVIDHMIGGARAFSPAFRGDQSSEGAEAEPAPAAQQPAAVHPAAGFRAAMADLLGSVQSPGALTRTVKSPFGEVPGAVFARFVVFDGLIHGWDLATSTGQPYDPPEALVAEVDAFARQALAPEMRDGDTFAAEAVAPGGATTLLGLVAFSGRAV